MSVESNETEKQMISVGDRMLNVDGLRRKGCEASICVAAEKKHAAQPLHADCFPAKPDGNLDFREEKKSDDFGPHMIGQDIAMPNIQFSINEQFKMLN